MWIKQSAELEIGWVHRRLSEAKCSAQWHRQSARRRLRSFLSLTHVCLSACPSTPRLLKAIIALSACLVLLFARQAGAQVAVTDTPSATASSTATSFNIAFTPSGTNRAMLVYVFSSDSAMTVSSAAWNTSETLSEICHASSDESTAYLFGRVAPSTGTHNVSVTIGSTRATTIVITTFTGVDQVAPFGTGACDAYAGSGISDSNTVTAQVGGLVADFFSLDTGGGTITLGGSQTSQTGPTTGDCCNTVYSTKAGASSVTTSNSWPNDFWRWVHASVGVNPASSACTFLLLGVGKCG